MTKQEYNGWYNYETWLVGLWIDNEPNHQAFVQSLARRSSGIIREYELSKELKSYFEELSPVTSGLFADFINASLSEVNWLEVIKHYSEEWNREEAI